MSTWILLRGLTRESRHWGDFPELLRAEITGARVIALDLPGNGDLNAMTSPATILDMASLCRAQLARQGVPPPHRLLALSMGAMVATAWAEKHPAEIDACVLINTSFGPFSPLHHRLRPRAWPLLLRLLLARTASRREEIVFRLTSRLAYPSQRLLDEWMAIRHSRPVRMTNALRQLIAAARFRAPVSAPVATLLLTSARDALVDTRCSTEIAHRWNCTISVHPTAGHDLPLDDGAWVANTIRGWLAAD